MLRSWLIAVFLLVSIGVAEDDASEKNDCQPVTWQPGLFDKRDSAETYSPDDKSLYQQVDEYMPVFYPSNLITTGDISPGEINCRDTGRTGPIVNYYSCTILAEITDISNDVFFMLNPTLNRNCSNIEPYTEYCIRGFIEPVRARDGKCGPPNKNATCLGMPMGQCCNAKTWRCGDSDEDCADGTCYEGACAGDVAYSTDGTCGYMHGYRKCGGVQGDCCHINGTCGTGEAFCSNDNCQSGNCNWTDPATALPGKPDGIHGNSSDSTCGGPDNITCNISRLWCWMPNTIWDVQSDQFNHKGNKYHGANNNIIKDNIQIYNDFHFSFTDHNEHCQDFGTIEQNNFAYLDHFSHINNDIACCELSAHLWSDLHPDADFNNGIRDCSNGACGSTTGTIIIAYINAMCRSVLATAKPTTPTKPSPTTQRPTATITDIASLPSCGQICFNNMLGEHSSLGCPTAGDAACICKNANFGYGVRDCANAACPDAGVAGTVISFEGAYCAKATGSISP